MGGAEISNQLACFVDGICLQESVETCPIESIFVHFCIRFGLIHCVLKRMFRATHVVLIQFCQNLKVIFSRNKAKD